jgi:glycosyl hydrolase family 76
MLQDEQQPVRMRAVWRLPVTVIVCLGIVTAGCGLLVPGVIHGGISSTGTSVTDPHRMAPLITRSRAEIAVAASRGIVELAGSGDHSPESWWGVTGIWGGSSPPAWWQTALALRTLVRYLERTGNTDPKYQRVLLTTYARNLSTPHAEARYGFVNKYLDDTTWWGLAWLEASKYELHYRHDPADAAKFLGVAEWDADFVASRPRDCGGIEWEIGYPPDTITSAEFIALTAGLYDYRRSGYFHDDLRAAAWLADARGALRWLESTRLVNLKTGVVFDRLNARCNKVYGLALTYTEGEVADALVQMGSALRDKSYYRQAARFLKYTISPASGLISHGILRDSCEAKKTSCRHTPNRLDFPAFKGVFMDAVADWSAATGSAVFRGFVLDQASAILDDSIIDPGNKRGDCATPHTCQLGFFWAPELHPSSIGVTVATQASALDALTAMLYFGNNDQRAVTSRSSSSAG